MYIYIDIYISLFLCHKSPRIQVQAFHRNTNWTFPCDFTLTKPVNRRLVDPEEDLAAFLLALPVAVEEFMHNKMCRIFPGLVKLYEIVYFPASCASYL